MKKLVQSTRNNDIMMTMMIISEGCKRGGQSKQQRGAFDTPFTLCCLFISSHPPLFFFDSYLFDL